MQENGAQTEGSPVIHMHQGLVAHEEGAHKLQCRDLQGEVEGRDEAHRAPWPAHAMAHLPCVVS